MICDGVIEQAEGKREISINIYEYLTPRCRYAFKNQSESIRLFIFKHCSFISIAFLSQICVFLGLQSERDGKSEVLFKAFMEDRFLNRTF